MTLRTLFCVSCLDFNKVSIKYRLYPPKSTKNNAFEEKVCKCHSSSHHWWGTDWQPPGSFFAAFPAAGLWWATAAHPCPWRAAVRPTSSHSDSHDRGRRKPAGEIFALVCSRANALKIRAYEIIFHRHTQNFNSKLKISGSPSIPICLPGGRGCIMPRVIYMNEQY